ncbi:MAG: hypothetical protein IKU24_03780, partial [Clostridia bacterium]|nr:hypothetical protein [Clostridia bacterium]
SQQLTSGAQAEKSVYSTYLEEQALLTEEVLKANEERVKEARRELAEKTFRTMLTMNWTPAEDFEYTIDSTTYVMKKGTTYYGLPYAHGAQSLQAHMLFLDSTLEDGTMVMNFKKEFLSGGGATSRLGFNREDGLIQAWHMVSDSSFASVTQEILPQNGYLPVGDYKIPKVNGVSVYADNSLAGDTPAICEENGEQGMYQAYASLLKADGLVKMNAAGGDAMMVVSVSVVENEDGTINGDESKVVIMKQTAVFSNAEEVGSKKYEAGEGTFAEVDKEYTFAELFAETFIPITVKELIDSTPTAAVAISRDSLADRTKFSNMYAGLITATRRVAYMTHTVLDSEGKVLTKGTHLATQADLQVAQKRLSFDISRVTKSDETGRYLFESDVLVEPTLGHKYTGYVKGETYRNVVTITTVTGETFTVRDYTFVHGE